MLGVWYNWLVIHLNHYSFQFAASIGCYGKTSENCGKDATELGALSIQTLGKDCGLTFR